MNAQLWGVLLGVGGGIGLAVVLAALLDRRPTLVARMRAGLPAGVAGAVTTPATPLVRGTMRVLEVIGSTNTSVGRRLGLLGRGGTLSAFRLQQVLVSVLGMTLAAGASAAMVVGRGGAAAVLMFPLLFLGALVGAALWDQLLTVRARARQRSLDAQVPDASELLALAVGAGESVPGALERVSGISTGDLSQELARTCHEIRLGTATSRALEGLVARNDSPSLERLCQTLATAIERGSPLAQVLHDQARDIREATRQELMEQGGRREIAMLVPVVFLILPVTVVFALYPGLVVLGIGP